MSESNSCARGTSFPDLISRIGISRRTFQQGEETVALRSVNLFLRASLHHKIISY